jgi:hypothetical protein
MTLLALEYGDLYVFFGDFEAPLDKLFFIG